MSREVCRQLLVRNKLGLHARAATRLAKLVNEYDAQVVIRQDGKQVDASSVMGLMLLASQQGKEIEVVATGPDAEGAMAAVSELFAARFDEAE